MLRRLSLLLAVPILALVGLSAPANAEVINQTFHQKGAVETFVDVLPTCEGGEDYRITTTANLVDKLQTNTETGTVHATFTQTGTAVLVPLDGTGPTYTGKFTVWGGFNLSNQNVNGTFTFNVNLVGSDGSRISTHQVEHFNERPDGTVQEFFKCQ